MVTTVSLSSVGRKAAKLAARGARRVFAVDVEQKLLLEWSTSDECWCQISASAHIEDPVFEVPLPVEALVHAENVDDAVVRALIAKNNPVIVQSLAQAHEQGRREGVAFAKGRRE